MQADGRTFGGQMIAQCLHCAYETLSSEFTVHSFHCYFLRPGSEQRNCWLGFRTRTLGLSSQPMEYAVTRLRDGQNFAARRVEARQNAKLAFTIDFSFQKVFPTTPSKYSQQRSELNENHHTALSQNFQRIFVYSSVTTQFRNAR